MLRKYILIYVLFFLFTNALFCFAQDESYPQDPEIVRLVNEGIKLHKDKDYLGALKSFSEALSIEPNNVLVKQNISIAHNNYGKYLAERTDYEKALKEFRLAIYYDSQNKTADANLDALLKQKGVRSDDPQARTQIGDKLRADANFELALIEYQKALSLSKSPDPNLLISIGDIHYILYLREGQKTNDIDKANDYYKKALEIKETAKAHIKVGDGLLALKDIAGAVQHYKRALELEPNLPDALTANIRGWNEAVRLAPLVSENHIGLAVALQLKKDFVNAEEEYNQALKLDPNNETALKGLESLKKDKVRAQAAQYSDSALKLQVEEKYDEAIEQYIKALEINPGDSKLHYNIGTAFQAKGDFEHAEKAYRKSLETDAANEKAKSALEQLTKQINAKKTQELSSRAVELQKSGNFQEAITTYLAAISIDSSNASLLYNLGTAYQAAGDLTNAQTQYQKALDLDKNNQTYSNAIKLLKTELANPLIQSAVNKQSSNDYAGAVAEYTKALELVPDDAQTHFNLATAYQANKQTDQAIQSYLKAVGLDPKGQVDAFFFLGTLYEEKKNNKSAIENYQKYIQNAPTGSYAKDAKERTAYLKTQKQ
ncbi:MAG: tetratricopeptide repeat protein [Candidatus Melainabacteria bacterium]|nr:tetratricopeptide repeat protein [Candidatus Melainabacteria bacterium]